MCWPSFLLFVSRLCLSFSQALRILDSFTYVWPAYLNHISNVLSPLRTSPYPPLPLPGSAAPASSTSAQSCFDWPNMPPARLGGPLTPTSSSPHPDAALPQPQPPAPPPTGGGTSGKMAVAPVVDYEATVALWEGAMQRGRLAMQVIQAEVIVCGSMAFRRSAHEPPLVSRQAAPCTLCGSPVHAPP